MRIDLEFMELHSPLFFAGINWGTKIDKKSKGGVEIYFETFLFSDGTSTEKYILVYGNKMHMVDGVAGSTLSKPAQLGVMLPTVTVVKPIVAEAIDRAMIKAQATGPERTIRTAQVSTPLDKVQGKPGRKPKYQGEETQGE